MRQKRIVYNKLIRDRIPAVIVRNGGTLKNARSRRKSIEAGTAEKSRRRSAGTGRPDEPFQYHRGTWRYARCSRRDSTDVPHHEARTVGKPEESDGEEGRIQKEIVPALVKRYGIQEQSKNQQHPTPATENTIKEGGIPLKAATSLPLSVPTLRIGSRRGGVIKEKQKAKGKKSKGKKQKSKGEK